MAGAPAPGTLIWRGGRTLPDLVFQNFYYGTVWQTPLDDNPHIQLRVRIDQAIALAMGDPALDEILAQYCHDAPVTTRMLPSEVVAEAPGDTGADERFTEKSVRAVIARLLPGPLAGLDLSRTAINLVLRHNLAVAILGVDGQTRIAAGLPAADGVPLDTPDRQQNIAGFHGSMEFPGGVEVIYSVVVRPDGPIGIAVPGWQPWETMAATLYHELQEIRTDPDVDAAIRTGDVSKIGWNTAPMAGPDGPDCREIADLALIRPGVSLLDSFRRVPVAAGGTVPIQRLWSNRDNALMPAP